MEGFHNIIPEIEKLSFDDPSHMTIHLKDGRAIVTPLSYFPSILILNLNQRLDWYITDGQMFSFEDCDEVFHLEQVLGKEQVYKYHFQVSQ
jgi:hypothetical protein